MVDALEPVIDRYMDRVDLPPKFVISGGTTLSAQLDVARTVIRRAERRVVALKEEGALASQAVLRYLNRASDLVFAMARFADIDDPEEAGGADEGPSPTRAVGAALAACAAITIEMYADRKDWDLRDVRADVDMEYRDRYVPRSFDVTLHVAGDLSEEQIERLRVIAAKCPIHRMLAHDPDVTITDRIR